MEDVAGHQHPERVHQLRAPLGPGLPYIQARALVSPDSLTSQHAIVARKRDPHARHHALTGKRGER